MKKKIILILPAYNASTTLVPFLENLPKNIFDDIILVDDCSTDGTYALAKSQKGIKTYQTSHNHGYGGNLKYCLSKALLEGADAIVELHPDGEYGTDGILPALRAVQNGAAMVLGNRFLNGMPQGMRIWKYPVTRILTWIDNVFLRTRIQDMHQGFRVYTRQLLEKVNYKKGSDDYLFSFEIIAQAAYKKLPIESVAVTTRYFGIKRGASLQASALYTLKTFWILYLFALAKCGFKIPLFS
jgi:glycosyltransferase involved in cell wall biosynthesis